jgi:hypothetical protein
LLGLRLSLSDYGPLPNYSITKEALVFNKVMPLTDRLQDLAELEEDLEHFTEIDLSVFLSKNETV